MSRAKSSWRPVWLWAAAWSCWAARAGPELDAGLEVAAGFADGLEGAVELGRAGAPAVAEQAVVLAAQPGHLGSGGVGGELGGLAVEGLDLLADGEVLISDGAAGDLRIAQGHVQAAVAQQGGDGFQAHAAVDRLGGQGVPELMGVDMGQAGGGAGPVDHPGDGVPVQRAAVFAGQQQRVIRRGRAWPGRRR